jgi:hypothetical protein
MINKNSAMNITGCNKVDLRHCKQLSNTIILDNSIKMLKQPIWWLKFDF